MLKMPDRLAITAPSLSRILFSAEPCGKQRKTARKKGSGCLTSADARFDLYILGEYLPRHRAVGTDNFHIRYAVNKDI
jgi:hypothetical protein